MGNFLPGAPRADAKPKSKPRSAKKHMTRPTSSRTLPQLLSSTHIAHGSTLFLLRHFRQSLISEIPLRRPKNLGSATPLRRLEPFGECQDPFGPNVKALASCRSIPQPRLLAGRHHKKMLSLAPILTGGSFDLLLSITQPVFAVLGIYMQRGSPPSSWAQTKALCCISYPRHSLLFPRIGIEPLYDIQNNHFNCHHMTQTHDGTYNTNTTRN
jgi:hypothetical protein